MWTAGLPELDLLVRTSGERRISNFLLWQCAYAELYFSEVLWPDFRDAALFEAIADFQGRQRPFGLLAAAAGAVASSELVLMFAGLGLAEAFGIAVGGAIPLAAAFGQGGE